jgi:hypothetical protein
MTESEIRIRIVEIKNVELPAIKTAIIAVLTGGHSQYMFDSGQSSQQVKRLDLTELRLLKNDLEEELARLENSLGSSCQIGRPYF